jgi:hypothetical protein
LNQTLPQTLVGHGGTVTAVAATRGCVVSTSIDGTLRVWRAERDRQLLLYPSFVCVVLQRVYLIS